MDLTTDWTEAGEAELDAVVELRRAIHADPEIGLDCPRKRSAHHSFANAFDVAHHCPPRTP